MKTLEIELTNYCWLKCISCAREQFKSFWFFDIQLLDSIILFIKENDYERVNLCWIGDVFLHKDIFKILNILFKEINGITIVINTKWDSLDDNKIWKLKNIVDKWYNLLVYWSIFSFNDKDHNFLTWSKYWYKMILSKLVLLKKNKVKIWTEFLLTSYSYKDLKKYYKLCDILWTNPAIQKLANWWWNLDDKIYSKLFWDKKLLLSHNIYSNKKEKEWCVFHDNTFLQIDYLWNIFKCCFFQYNRDLSLWNISNTSYEDIFKENNNKKKVYKNVCETCIYYKYDVD
jgi:MoaA/NifB/PqqE/SkfB family radical SAM enzyme